MGVQRGSRGGGERTCCGYRAASNVMQFVMGLGAATTAAAAADVCFRHMFEMHIVVNNLHGAKQSLC